MNSISGENNPGLAQWKQPLLAIALSAAFHGMIWRAWIEMTPEPEPVITPPQVIEVSLVTAQPQAAPEPPKPQVRQPAPLSKPEPKPEKPVPKKPEKPRPKPKPMQRLEPVSEPSPATPPAPSSPVEAPAAPVQTKPAAPPQSPVTEASYKSPGLNNPPTRYPRLALERQWEGTVTLRVQVLTNGSAGEIKIERSSGHDILDEATVEQVKNWRFLPARRGDLPVVGWVIVPIDYKLKH